MSQVFVSHTKRDEKFCDEFDRVCAGVGIKRFQSEFETIPPPPWKTIKKAIDNSVALFFLVGKELVNSQDSNDPQWRYTQNWIAYEIGLACERGIDVWAICDDVLINFPMPYINNYLTVGLKHKTAFNYLKLVLERYQRRKTFPVSYPDELSKYLGVECPYDNCKMAFHLHTRLYHMSGITCPQCLRNITFPKGHLT